MPEIKKILVIRLSSLGDIILTFPLLRKLKEKLPGAEIHFLTKRAYESAVSLAGLADRILLYEDMSNEGRKKISEENYDMVLDLHKNPRTLMLTLFLKNVRRYRKENLKKFLLVKFKINLFKKIVPVYRKYLETIKELLDSSGYDYYPVLKNTEYNRIVEGKYIVIAPSSKHFTKTYPAEKFIEFISDLKLKNPGLKVVLTGDSSDRDMRICRHIHDECPDTIDLCGQLDLSELAGVLKNSEYVVCNDSAVLHLSEALGKKVISIFGSTVEEFGFFPQLKDSVVFQITGLSCRPCTHVGRDTCPEGHFKCMKLIKLT